MQISRAASVSSAVSPPWSPVVVIPWSPNTNTIVSSSTAAKTDLKAAGHTRQMTNMRRLVLHCQTLNSALRGSKVRERAYFVLVHGIQIISRHVIGTPIYQLEQ